MSSISPCIEMYRWACAGVNCYQFIAQCSHYIIFHRCIHIDNTIYPYPVCHLHSARPISGYFKASKIFSNRLCTQLTNFAKCFELASSALNISARIARRIAITIDWDRLNVHPGRCVGENLQPSVTLTIFNRIFFVATQNVTKACCSSKWGNNGNKFIFFLHFFCIE